jgi:hypothetical protein
VNELYPDWILHHFIQDKFHGSEVPKFMVVNQYPEVGYLILIWDTRTLNPGIPVRSWIIK